MDFLWSTLKVKDMEESLKFYSEVIGLTVNTRFKAGPNTEIAFLGKEETKIELICDESSQSINVGSDISWGFKVSSLEDTIILLKQQNIDIESGPFQPNPHIKYLFINDPNGMKLQLVEKL